MTAQAHATVFQSDVVPDRRAPELDSPAAIASLHLLRGMLESQRAGQGVLPLNLGLEAQELQALVASYLPDCLPLLTVSDAGEYPGLDKGRLRQELLGMRRDEWRDVRDLLLAECTGNTPLEVPMASIVAAGCLGGDHLWRDLALPTRKELNLLLTLNFETVAARNVFDMKWKKFFYKQLCEREGGYVCRAPSCEACTVYDDCFGPEE